MKLWLPLLGLTLLLALPTSPAAAENENWSDLKKEFGSQFKAKNSLSDRRSAVKTLAQSEDGRAVPELLDATEDQEKIIKKLRKEWEAEEEAWQEKTEKFMEAVNRRKPPTIRPDEDEWLGWSGNRRGKMHDEKDRIAGLYKNVLEEEQFLDYIFKSVARLLNSLEGEEATDAAEKAGKEAKRAKDDRKPHFIKMLAYVKGPGAVDALTDLTKDTDPEVVMSALEALGRNNSEQGAKVLIEHLEDPRWQIRASAIQGLSFYKDPTVVDALIDRAKREEGVLQRHFFTALARIVQEQVPGTVEAWDSWWTANREIMERKWEAYPKGEPIEHDPPDVPIDTSLGSTSFYGIRTNSKHIIFVVDISGSMGEQGGVNDQGHQRIDVARNELKQAIQSLSADDGDERGEASFNIVLFNTTVQVYKEGKMIDATASQKEKAVKWIDEHVQANEQTNIYDACEQAFNIISSSRDSKNFSKGADTIFLMTDGSPNMGKFADPELILHEVKELNRTRKITIHTIGVGEGHNAPFLRSLAAQNNGQYLAR